MLDSVAQVLKDRIYDNADISKVVTPEVITEMKQAFPDNNKWASWVDNNVATAKTGKDLRSAQAPFVRMSKILNEAENNAGTFGQKMGNFAKTMATSNPLGMIVNGAKILADTNIGRRAMASVEDYLANRSSNKNSGAQGISRGAASNTAANEANDSISASNADYNPATQIYNMIGRAEGLSNAEQARTADYLVDAAQEAEIVPNSDTIKDVDSGTTILPNDTSSTSIYNALTGQITNGQASITQGPVQFSNSYPSTTGDYWTDIIGNAMMAAAEANDVNAFAALYEMYQNASSNASSNSEAKTVSDLNATQQNQLAKLETASSAIDELEALYDNAGGGKGVIFGNLQNIGGSLGLDSNARTYSKMAEGLVNQIAQAIGKTDSLNTEGEVQRALQLIPQLTDDAQTAKNKLEFLRRMLQETTSNYLSAYGVQ